MLVRTPPEPMMLPPVSCRVGLLVKATVPVTGAVADATGSVPPGAAVCPQHAHTVQWELFVVLHGTATVRANEETWTVTAGDAFLQPPDTAHQIINAGRDDLVFYIIADNPPADSTWYPNSKKWQMKPQRKLFRMTEVDYYDGEE